MECIDLSCESDFIFVPCRYNKGNVHWYSSMCLLTIYSLYTGKHNDNLVKKWNEDHKPTEDEDVSEY